MRRIKKLSLSAKARGVKLGVYEHFKGNRYRVIGVAFHSETLAEMVVYRRIGGDRHLSVRPLAMFLETVERGGKRVKRFRYCP